MPQRTEAGVDSIFVVGTDTLAGANLAAHWTDGGGSVNSFQRDANEAESGPIALDEARAHLAAAKPNTVVYCGAASESAWSYPSVGAAAEGDLRVWARAVREFGSRFTYLSSDALFTGPWLFHAEDSTHHCRSLEAGRMREMEELVQRIVPEALIVRTNTFGWSSNGDGWIETLIACLEDGTIEADPVRHATPILATDLASILTRAHEEGLNGFLHVGGAERVSHAVFLRMLAEQFALPAPETHHPGSLASSATGFGRGETSLRTSRAKNVLNLAMPSLAEGFARLHSQNINGFRSRLGNQTCELYRVA
jgi:dTDP-4-dehydrorhamnose reductase